MVQELRTVQGPQVLATQSEVSGRAICMADGSGRNHPVPLTYARIHTTDRTTIGLNRGPELGWDPTEWDGSFKVITSFDLRWIPWSLDLTNAYTQQRETRRSTQGASNGRLVYTVALANPSTYFDRATGILFISFDVGTLVLAWDPMLPKLARVNGRDFDNPSDLARTLRSQLNHDQGEVWLFREFDRWSAVRDRELDSLFKALPAASPDVVGRIAKAVSLALKLNPFKNIQSDEFTTFAQAVERIAVPRSRTDHDSLLVDQIAQAIAKALGMSSLPPTMNDPATGLAAVAVILFVAGHIAKGRKASVWLSQLEDRKDPRRRREYKTVQITVS